MSNDIRKNQDADVHQTKLGKVYFKQMREGYYSVISGGMKTHLRAVTNVKKHLNRTERRKVKQQINTE